MTQPTSTASQPDALTGAGLRRVVSVLSITQITSWGVLYYAFAALSSSITADTGWTSVAVTGAFSLSQFVAAGAGIWVGRHIDAYGPRRVMTAGSLVAIPAVLTIASAPNLGVFYVGWVLAGIAMAGVLYPPAFAALTHWAGERRVGALTTLTLVAGLASTVFAPLTAALVEQYDWRVTYLVLATILAAIAIAGHFFGLRGRWPDPPTASRTRRRRSPRRLPQSTVRRARDRTRPGRVRRCVQPRPAGHRTGLLPRSRGGDTGPRRCRAGSWAPVGPHRTPRLRYAGMR